MNIPSNTTSRAAFPAAMQLILAWSNIRPSASRELDVMLNQIMLQPTSSAKVKKHSGKSGRTFALELTAW
jgi:hypothetical protein